MGSRSPLSVAAVTLGLVPAASDAADRRCPVGKTVAATDQARVVRGAGGLWGCRGERGRAVRLDTGGDCAPDDCGLIGRLRLVGRHVAYESATHTRYGDYSGSVVVIDLRRSRRVHRLPQMRGGSDPPPGPGLGVSDLVLTRQGTAAWMARVGYGSFVTHVVQASRGRRGVVTLDDSPEVLRRSLALSPARLYWTRAGQPRSARLP